ncbi:MAG: hypothetical protein IME92_05215 [Proteobacteria bacterium]|nr:hypothetical protein [Pseudomonadota bacterium]
MSGANSNISDRRKRNNLMLGGVLLGFVALVFLITVAKMMNGAGDVANSKRVPVTEQSE